MANRIKLKRSTVPGKAPLAADLEVGEIAVNTADGVLYTKHTDNSVRQIGGAANLSVSLFTMQGGFANTVSSVTGIRFDEDSGFDVTDLGGGNVKVAMNSTFKYITVDGQGTLVAVGLDTLHVEAGNNIVITSNANASPQSLRFSVNSNPTFGNVRAGAVYTDNYFYANGAPFVSGNGNVVVGGNVTLTSTGNSNIYNGFVYGNTGQVLVDSLPLSGNTNIRWQLSAKDNINGRYKSSIIDSLNDGSSVFYDEYSTLYSHDNHEVATYVVNAVDGLVKLFVTGESANVTVTFQRVSLGSSIISGYMNDTVNNGNIGGMGGTGITNVNIQNMFYVTKGGSDSNTGSLTSPFATIKHALSVAGTTGNATVFVAPGNYTEDNPVTIPARVSLMGNDLRTVNVYPQDPSADFFYVKNACYVWGITLRDYLANGFSYDPSTPNQNVFVSPYIQNLTSATTTGTAVKIDGNLTSAISTKAMIVGFFTIINKGGIGIHLTNLGYSQLVNIYTIACNKGIWAESGAFCTLNGSDTSIGNYGLVADGTGPLASQGQTLSETNVGTFQIRNLNTPPRINQTMVIDGDPKFYSIDTITQVDSITWEVSVQEIYTNILSANTTVSFYQRSAIVASSHTFEYVGAGTNPATALPQYGGIPVESQEVVMTNGGRVTFTSTDHKGNFKIGSNLVINQATGTISGDSFTRSMFALMTPYILALQ